MSIFKNLESCPNCVHKDVCMYKEDYAKFVADLEKDDRLLPAGVDFIEPHRSDSREKISDIDQESD